MPLNPSTTPAIRPLHVLKVAAGWVADAIAPCLCAACGLPSRRPLHLCDACEVELPWLECACTRCALPATTDSPLCGRCLKSPPRFDAVTAACRFVDPVRSFIYAFKDRRQLAMAPVLVELLAQSVADRLSDGDAPDLLVPMPLHWTRRWHRGFNQARVLAQGLRRHPLLAGRVLKLDDRLCQRRRRTQSQRALTVAQRRRNLRGAMVCTRSVEGCSIAVVDDVLTTGASADAVAFALKAAGAARVEIWCCARTPMPGR
jgi:ComF family protein